jgi:hypothetical protein
MSTRIVLNGKTAWASKDYWDAQPRRDMLIRRERQVQKVGELNAAAQAKAAEEAEYVHPPRASPALPGQPFTDPDGATYRLVDNLSAADVWVGAGTLMAWYKVPYAQVVDWVRRGLVDGVIQRGSPTKRYRVIDAAGCLAEAQAFATAQAKVKGAKKPK